MNDIEATAYSRLDAMDNAYNPCDLYATKLREIGEKLIKDSKAIVGSDPNTTGVEIRISLFEERHPQYMYANKHLSITRARSVVDIHVNKDLPCGGEEK